ncbi:MAG: GDP-L-fucose synthase [Rhodospirillales bacterium]|nr:MAG: GDP-L-fucose synthase [Rhodospirillales bacterium]
MKQNSKIYVAGHQGLVGRAIVQNLQDKGYTNLVTRTHCDLDLTDTKAVTSFFKEEKPECVILAAAKVGGIVANDTYPADFIYENLMIQNNVIHQSYKHGVQKLLFLGSSCIYPKDAPQPMPEECLLTGPLEKTNEPYALAKIAGIKMCESYNRQYGTDFMAVMPTNLYGPYDNFDLETAHVLPAIMRKIYLAKLLSEQKYDAVVQNLNLKTIEEARAYLSRFGVDENKVEIWGTGRPLREFLWSEDMADACIFLIETGHPFHTPINIGTGEEISIKDLAEMIKKTVGFEGALFFNAEKPDGTMRKLTDISKLRALGWKHTVALEEGIQKLFDAYAR